MSKKKYKIIGLILKEEDEGNGGAPIRLMAILGPLGILFLGYFIYSYASFGTKKLTANSDYVDFFKCHNNIQPIGNLDKPCFYEWADRVQDRRKQYAKNEISKDTFLTKDNLKNSLLNCNKFTEIQNYNKCILHKIIQPLITGTKPWDLTDYCNKNYSKDPSAIRHCWYRVGLDDMCFKYSKDISHPTKGCGEFDSARKSFLASSNLSISKDEKATNLLTDFSKGTISLNEFQEKAKESYKAYMINKHKKK